jgi:hypothetical protein
MLEAAPSILCRRPRQGAVGLLQYTEYAIMYIIGFGDMKERLDSREISSVEAESSFTIRQPCVPTLAISGALPCNRNPVDAQVPASG